MASNLTISPNCGLASTCTSVDGAFTINSYVFLDLETSHLHSSDRPTIIEISMVAVHRTGLLHPDVITSLERARKPDGMMDLAKLILPRVIDKITLCLDPRKHTSSSTFLLTKLDNLNLGESKKMPFDEGVVSMLELFLQRQEAPVCLIAHNGMNFDFSLLRTELARLGAEKKFEGIFCIDSLEALRADFGNADLKEGGDMPSGQPPSLKRKAAIDDINLCVPSQCKKGSHQSDLTREKTSCLVGRDDSSLHISAIKLDHGDDGLPQEMKLVDGTSNGSACTSNTSCLQSHRTKSSYQNNTANSLCSSTDTTVPTANITSNHNSSASSECHSVPSNLVQIQTNGATAVGELAPSSSPNCVPELSESPPRHTPPPPPAKTHNPDRYAYVHTNDNAPKVSYSLVNVFKRTFGREPPVSHAAEDDITSLMKILLPRVQEFVQWADKNMTEFNSIDFYYKPRKAKRKLLF